MSCCQHRSPWPSLAARLYCPSLPGGYPGLTLYRYRAVVYRFKLIVLTFARPCEGVHRSSSLMSLSLLLQQCPTCLVRLTWVVFVTGGGWPYSCCFVGCCLQDLSNTTRSIFVLLPSSLFSIYFVCIHVVHPYSSIDTTTAWKKLCFISSVRSNFHMTNSLSLAVHTFARCVLMSFSVDETLLPR